MFLPKSLLLTVALGPRTLSMLGPVTAGKAPEAEEERDRLVRGFDGLLLPPALSCAVEGLHSRWTHDTAPLPVMLCLMGTT